MIALCADWGGGLSRQFRFPRSVTVQDRLVYVIDLSNGSLAVTIMKTTIGAEAAMADGGEGFGCRIDVISRKRGYQRNAPARAV